MKSFKKEEVEYTHFYQAKEVISSWSQWKQELAKLIFSRKEKE